VYINNQKTLKKILEEYDVYSLNNNYEKVNKINEITYKIINKTFTHGGTSFVCRTPIKILNQGGNCGDHVHFELSMLHILNIDSHPLGLCPSSENDDFSHVVVEANINNKWLIFDPLYNMSPGKTSNELNNPIARKEYLDQTKQTKMEYSEEWDFDDTARFRYGLFGPFKKIAQSIGNLLNKVGLDLHQPYFMLRCELRYMILTGVFLGLILGIYVYVNIPLLKKSINKK